MSKITFRADDDLVDAVEDLDASKSEVMRDALRSYLQDAEASDTATDSLDDAVAERVNELVERRIASRRPPERDVNVRVTVEPGEGFRRIDDRAADRGRAAREERKHVDDRGAGAGNGRAAGRGNGDRRANADAGASCGQCGESLSDDHVYCPNCGEKATRRVFCECGDEVRADWSFCPHCGRRTASADALDR
ncbi:MAG: zinc ribbon domain-containing protein [Halobacterium sp.]